MKIVGLMLFLAFATFGQTAKDEIKELKDFLTLPEKTEIVLSMQSVAKADRLNLYLAFGLDTQIYKNFNKWIDEWNKKDAKKHGKIEIVSELAKADIVLVRYTKKDKISSETNSRVASQMSFDPKTMKTTNTPVQQTYSISVVPVLAYILKPQNDTINIIDRYSDTASVTDTDSSGKDLWEKLKKLLKAKN